ncbi:MAG: prohibitin family protein [Oscillatoriales cyanobacterium SM2_1_8]|nr:prohibitin family protein [Oscillatoriales cyanobacterium SM2_1_8]
MDRPNCAGLVRGQHAEGAAVFLRDRPGEAAVVFNTFAGLQLGRILMPGATFLVPGVEQAVAYDVRTRVWEFTNLASPRKASGAIAVIASDGQSFTLDANVVLRPNPETLDELHARLGENYLTTAVVPVVRSKLRDVSARFKSEDFYRQEKRREIEQEATDLMNQEMPMVERNGTKTPLILIEGVLLETANFPEALKASIEKKQVAAILAQTAGVKAQIQAKETERVLILAKAEERAIELKGRAAALGAQLADLLFYERLQARIAAAQAAKQPSPLRIVRIEGDSTVFLNLDPQQAALTRRAP